MNEEEKKAIKVINKRTKRLLDELEIEKEDMVDEPRIVYLMQEIRANKTILNLIEKLQKELEELKDTNCLVKRYFKLKDTNTYLQKENEELHKEIERMKSLDIYKLVEDWETGQLISVQEVKDKMEKDLKINEHTILGGRRNGKTLEYGKRLGRIEMCQELLEGRK